MRRKRGQFNHYVGSFTEWAVVLVCLCGGGLMTWVLLRSGYNPSPKLIGFTVVLYGVGVFELVRCLMKMIKNRRDTLSRRAERRHPGYVDVPLTKIQPPMHRGKRSPRS